VAAVLLLLLLLTGCARPWAIELSGEGGSLGAITDAQWRAWAEAYPGEVVDDHALPLERALWELGVTSIEALAVGNTSFSHIWADVADDAWLRDDGRVVLNGNVQEAELLIVASPPEASLVTAHITDVAPAVTRALGIAAPALATGSALDAPTAEHVVFIFLDGLGYRRYLEGRPRALTPFLDSLGEPHIARTFYPSVTRVSTAAFITGAPPAENDVRDRSTRNTEVETIFDVLTAQGRSSIAVEGDSLAFNLRNTETVLSGDRDGNGHSDDNTYANALTVIRERMPDFLWVHFHGIDDVGHTYGRDAVEADIKLAEVDGYVRDLVDALPEDTLVIIGADHGMHNVDEGERRGNHGTLQPDDMFVPLWTLMP